ncbi:MAG TPA: hypothetical protein VFJ30_12110, partial [Phycisphaerae bacterium]|nr:hypothetical protein [Phycisphaerae bacterium]
FKELPDVQGEKYAVYRCDQPITAGALSKAVRMAVIDEDSGSYKAEQRVKVLAGKTKVPNYNFRYIIRDNPTNDPAAQLAEGVGLFVYTVKSDGKRHYAVVPVIGGKETPALMAATEEPVEVKATVPGAVMVWKSPMGAGFVYTHWMDGETWDPFCEGNAYNFGVGLPDKYDGTSALPVMFYGHGMSGTYSAPDKTSYGSSLWVWHGDKTGSWFLGVMNAAKDRVVNYAEQRVRWSAEWLKAARANQPWKVDMTHVNAHGHSMGGTGNNDWGLRMGDIFCITVDSAGATIHSRNKVWVGQASKLWGPVDKDLPLETRRYDYSGGKLTITRTNEGGVWSKYQNYAQWSLDHMGQDTAWMTISHGKRDGSVVFEPVPDYLDALQRSKRPFAANWNLRGHSWQGYGTRNGGWGSYALKVDETIPAFSNASNNDDPRTTDNGQINGKLEWSSSGNNFDPKGAADDWVDTAEMWAMNLRALGGDATVDVTPRKVQNFKTAPGARYAWENISFADPAKPVKVDSGTVTADRHGLVTVEKFKVGAAGLGNRLVVRPAK